MNWYYVKDGQQAGPVTEEQLEEMLRSGVIQADTLVWREGMAGWAAYTTAKASAPQPGLSMASGKGGQSQSQSAGMTALCAECGQSFPTGDMIRHGNAYVCAGCKPVFMQRLAEGAPRDQAHTYAGFGTRFAAQFVDNIIIGVISVPLAFALAGAMPGQDPGLVAMVALPFRFVILFIYDTLMIGKFGATLGKMACKTKVVNANGTDLSFGQAAGRAAMKVVSFLTCLIGFIIAAFDAERRALHDRACGTRVIVKR